MAQILGEKNGQFAMKNRNAEELRALVGLKITHVCEDGAWFGMVLEDGTVLTFSRDPEGNGPGHVFINRPKPSKRSRK